MRIHCRVGFPEDTVEEVREVWETRLTCSKQQTILFFSAVFSIGLPSSHISDVAQASQFLILDLGSSIDLIALTLVEGRSD